MESLFLNVSPLVLLILSKSLGIFLGSWYATIRVIDIRCSRQCNWSTPLEKISNLGQRIDDFRRSEQPPSNLQGWSSIYQSIMIAKRNILRGYILFASFFWVLFEYLDNSLHLSSEFARRFSPFDMLLDIPITAFISYLILSCDATIEAEGGLIIDLVKQMQKILNIASEDPMKIISKSLSRYEDLEKLRCYNYSGDQIIELSNEIINGIQDRSLQKKYREKFQGLRRVIEHRDISNDDLIFSPIFTHEKAYEQLLTVYIEICLDYL